MARGAYKRKRSTAVFSHDRVYGRYGRACSETSDIERLVTDRRVDIQMSSAVVNEAADVPNHFCAVAAGKVLFRCRTWRKALQSLAEVFVGFECLQNALQPFLCFEVRHSRVMPEECGVV